ncbi:hypothetical protein QVD17_16420 [Tagetes erecta]|uniref:Acetolactate synthase n=1 Tax=Tagetes erecta TaxID=13708 RepID=A0AAD8P0Q0_TARER|nr:hypothetical protein QVD17_16420 [Tagetes erecta]
MATYHASNTSISGKPPFSTTPSQSTTNQLHPLTLTPLIHSYPKTKPTITKLISNSKPTTITTIPTTLPPPPPPHEAFVSRFGPNEPRKGSDVLVEALEREGVTNVFAYPGGATLEIHQSLTRSSIIRNILPRNEQGGVFAASGYARASGLTGVCIATSGPGAINILNGLADALLDSIPLVAITGQVPRNMMGTDTFQDTPIVEMARPITKHSYIVLNVHDIPRIVHEAFCIASSGRPGPVLIDIPKDILHELVVPNWDDQLKMLSGYMSRLPKQPNESRLRELVWLINESKKPVLYVGGGCVNSSDELCHFVELTGIPVTNTLMGLGTYPGSHDLSLQMLGMHGTVYANYAVDKSDLLLAFGVRFDDRVTGKLEAFARRAKVVHIDIDPAEIGKIKQPDLSICGDIKTVLQRINKILEKGEKMNIDLSQWHHELMSQKMTNPLSFKTFGDAIPPQYSIQVLHELTGGDAIIATGVGQHQMWSAQFYKYNKPRQWLTSGGLGVMGFGLPAAIGAAVARTDAVVVDIDGDGSFMMNVQELATVRAEDLPVKIMVLNNQYLGMVVQWEDRYYKANRAASFLGNPRKESEIFPNMLKFAEACDIPAARVSKKGDVEGAIRKMLDTPGPYLLDVIIPHQEHVLPMIPPGGGFKDIITEGDGRTKI